MFNKRTLAIIKRELREKLFSRTFIVMTLLVPVFLFGVLGIQTFVIAFGGNTKSNIEIVSPSPEIIDAMQKTFAEPDFANNKNLKISFETMSSDNLKSFLNSSKVSLLNEKLTGIIYIPDSSLIDKKIEYYSKNPNNSSLLNRIKQPINKALIGVYFKNQNLTNSQLSFVRSGVDVDGFTVSSDKGIRQAGIGNTVVAFLFTFLLYFSLIMIGTMVMRSVVQEKNNRIVEVLLSSASSTELMVGKILGNSITGLIQMFIWLLPLMFIISTSWFVLPAEFTLSITMGNVLFVLFYYFIGLITFLGLFASVGAIFDNDQDAQSGIWPIMILIMIPFFIAISLNDNPGNTIAAVASMFPFASIIVMPARIAVTEVPVYQIVISVVVSLATMFVIFPLAGKIYKVGILMTGKKPKWSEVMKWIKTA